LATTRVYILARELGVKSAAIVKKCQDEGLDVKNHMSVISAGLAATIREWFSEGENITTVEMSEKVDLEKVRVKKEKKARPKPPAKKTKAQKAKAAEPDTKRAKAADVAEPDLTEQETAAAELDVSSGTAVVTEEPPPAEEQIAEVPEPEPEHPLRNH